MRAFNHPILRGTAAMLCLVLSLAACPEPQDGTEQENKEDDAAKPAAISAECNEDTNTELFQTIKSLIIPNILKKLGMDKDLKGKKIVIKIKKTAEESTEGGDAQSTTETVALGSTAVDDTDLDKVTITISEYMQDTWKKLIDGPNAELFLTYVVAHELEHAITNLPKDSKDRETVRAYNKAVKEREDLKKAVKDGTVDPKEGALKLVDLYINELQAQLAVLEFELAEETRIQELSRTKHKEAFKYSDALMEEYFDKLEPPTLKGRADKIKEIKAKLKSMGVDVDADKGGEEDDGDSEKSEENKSGTGFFEDDSGQYLGDGGCALGAIGLTIDQGSITMQPEQGESFTLYDEGGSDYAAMGTGIVYETEHDCTIALDTLALASTPVDGECLYATSDCDEEDDAAFDLDQAFADRVGVYCPIEIDQALTSFTMTCSHYSGSTCSESFSI